MPQRDLHHDTVVQALEKAGWTITDDPLHLGYGDRNLYVDLGAENVLAAKKGHDWKNPQTYDADDGSVVDW